MVHMHKRVVTPLKGEAHRVHVCEVLLKLFERVVEHLLGLAGGKPCWPQMQDTAWLLWTSREMGLHMAVDHGLLELLCVREDGPVIPIMQCHLRARGEQSPGDV